MSRTLDDWCAYWNTREGDDRIALVDYCVEGRPLAADVYRDCVVLPNLETLAVRPGDDVLDIGCGTGLHLDALEPIAARLAGTDLSAALLATYRGRAETHLCAAHQQPFPPASFDRVLMTGVALYFPSDDYFEQVVTHIVGLLRPGGRALVGDMLLGPHVSRSGYRAYDFVAILGILERTGTRWAIRNQAAAKRRINKRFDIVLDKPE